MKTLNGNSFLTSIGLFVILGLFFSSCLKEELPLIQTEVIHTEDGESSAKDVPGDPSHKCFLASVGVDLNCSGTHNYLVVHEVTTSYQLCLKKVQSGKTYIKNTYPNSCAVLPQGLCKRVPCSF